jgi:hypothetical protein
MIIVDFILEISFFPDRWKLETECGLTSAEYRRKILQIHFITFTNQVSLFSKVSKEKMIISIRITSKYKTLRKKTHLRRLYCVFQI